MQQGFIEPADVPLGLLTKQRETQSLLQGTYILIRESTFSSGPFFMVSLKASSWLHGFSPRVFSVRGENIEYRIIQCWEEERTEVLRGLGRDCNHLILGTEEGRPRCVCGVRWGYHEDGDNG